LIPQQQIMLLHWLTPLSMSLPLATIIDPAAADYVITLVIFAMFKRLKFLFLDRFVVSVQAVCK